jgi:hypothetical protein
MKRARCLPIAIMALASVTGCDSIGPELAPTQPSSQAPAPGPAATVNGEIIITSISPAPGGTVRARACAPGSARFCADQAQMAFDVVVDQDIPNAVLTVSFERCAIASTPVTALSAGQRIAMSTSVLDLSDDGPLHDGVGAALFCALPAVTTTMTVSLWRSGEPARPLMTRKFPNGYTFAMP